MAKSGAFLLLAFSWGVASPLLAGPAAAQDNFTPPEVTVDLSVLDGLPPGSGKHVPLKAPGTAAAAPAKPVVAVKPPAPPKPVAEKPVAKPVKPVKMTPPPEPPPAVTAKDDLPPPKPAATQAPTPPPAPLVEAKPAPTPPPAPPAPPPSEAAKPATPPPSPPPAEEAKAPPAEPKVAAAAPPAPAKPATPAPPVKPATATPPPTTAPMPTGIVAPLHVGFAAGSSDLSDAAKQQLDSVAKSLGTDDLRRVQLIAYASGGPEEANQARRLSLSRALNVRAYLIDRGVRNTRMDVRALGNRPDAGDPADRVDVLFVEK